MENAIVPKLDFKFKEGDTVYYFDLSGTCIPYLVTIKKGIVGGGFMLLHNKDSNKKTIFLEIIGVGREVSQDDIYSTRDEAKEEAYNWIDKNYLIIENAKAMGIFEDTLRLKIEKGEILESDLKTEFGVKDLTPTSKGWFR